MFPGKILMNYQVFLENMNLKLQIVTEKEEYHNFSKPSVWFFLFFLIAAGQVEMPTPLSGGVIPATALPQGAQMTMQARRLYCGNLPFGITEVL